MKTRNYILLCVTALASFSLSSCGLDVTPTSDIADATYWKTEKDAWYALNYCYANMPDAGSGLYDENATDNAHSHKPWEGPFELIQQSAVTPGDLDGYYNYSQIRTATNFIANVDQCDMSDAYKTRMKAEAKVFRAIEYMNLVKRFGAVPLVTEVMDYNADNVERTDVATVRAFIIKELADAAAALPQKYNGGYMNETGRITRSAALALEARAALSYGDYATAEKAATTIITEGYHSLFKVNYANLNAAQKKEAQEMEQFVDFDALGINREKFLAGLFSYEGIWQGDNTGTSNPEYIMTHEYVASSSDNATDWVRYQYLRPSQLVTGYSSFEPLQGLVDCYWKYDGKTVPSTIDAATRQSNYKTIFSEVSSLDQAGYIQKVQDMNLNNFEYIKEFKNRDSRLYASILFPFKGWHETDFGTFYYEWKPSWFNTNGNESYSGYSWRKQVAIRPYDTGWGENYAYDDYPLIRYAEVLLIAAEAHLYNTGWDATAQGYVNQLRDRCGMPNVPTNLTKDEAISFLRNERRIELAGEGQRFDDLRRYGGDYYKAHMSGTSYNINGVSVVDMSYDSKILLMPIPQNAIKNNTKLTQNTGY
jgi:hypothetical protein